MGFLFGIFFTFTLFSALGVSAWRRPNFVLLVADDLGYNNVPWNDRTRTVLAPNLAKLTSEGITLDQFHAHATCTPSRAALFTGYYPHRTGLDNYAAITCCTPAGLPLRFSTLADTLKEKGYHTGLFGKWDLGSCAWNYTPTERGFDEFVGYYSADEHPYTHETCQVCVNASENILAYDFRDGKELYRDANGTYSTDIFTDEALDFIYDHRDEQFFLTVTFQAVHSPLAAPNASFELFEGVIEDPVRETYLAELFYLDYSIGLIIERLKSLNLWDDTYLWFLSDNGGIARGGGINYPLRGGKFSPYEGGSRVPSVFYGPGLKLPGTTSYDIVTIEDVYPTFTARVQYPSEFDERDGKDVLGMLNGGEDELTYRNYPITADFEDHQFSLIFGSDKYKLIYGYNETRVGVAYSPNSAPFDLTFLDTCEDLDPVDILEFDDSVHLYKLSVDPFEVNDLAEYNPAISGIGFQLLANEYLPEYFGYDLAGNILSARGNPELFGNVIEPGWCTPIN